MAKRINHNIDATNEIFGRLATRVALLVRGKNKVAFQPNIEAWDIVTIKNINKIGFSGKKYEQKTYSHHSGYVGHLKKEKLSHNFEKNPQKIFIKAVYNMLPKNKLRNRWLKNLKFE